MNAFIYFKVERYTQDTATIQRTVIPHFICSSAGVELVQENLDFKGCRVKATEEEEINMIRGKNHLGNGSHEGNKRDDTIEAEVKSSCHPISLEYIPKLALFYIYRKHDFMQHFFGI